MQTNYSASSAARQCDRSPPGRQIGQRLALIGVAGDYAEAALEYVAAGRPVAAAEVIRDIIEVIREAGRAEVEEVETLRDLAPVWRLDAALHTTRGALFSQYAPTGTMDTSGTFTAADEEGFALAVDANDNWRCSSGTADFQISGIGLTALLAHLRGESLVVTVERLTKWLEEKGGKQ